MEQVGNIEIIEAESNYKKVHKSIINNMNIDCQTLGIYVRIMSFGRKWQLNINGLSKHLQISDSGIRKSIVNLEAIGLLSRHPVRGDKGKFVGWNYRLYSDPIPETDRTSAGKRTCQITDSPFSGQDRKPTCPKTDLSENGEENNIRLNQLKDLNNFQTKKNTIVGQADINTDFQNQNFNHSIKTEKKEKEKSSAKKEKEINYSFDHVWDLYEKKVGKNDKVVGKWNELTNEQRQKAIEHIPEYVKSTPDKKFRKNFETYINNKSWNDEIIQTTNGNQNKSIVTKDLPSNPDYGETRL